jgi:thiamine biosynthesis lipoprotein
VKTWAASLAAEKLEQNGITDFAMNAGGDIRLSKEITPGFAMRIGISTPVTIASEDAGVLTVVDLNESNYRAVATSGNAERGEHIWNPKTNGWADQLAQVTVVSEDLVSADVWATALFAAGDQGLALAEKHGLQALFVDLEGQLFSTKSFTELLRPV